MAKLIEFTRDWFAEVESAPGRMRQVAFRRGTRCRAAVRPTDNSASDAPTADLQLTDGTTARGVPLAYFRIAEELPRAA
jgi:hypothetical protein